MEVYYEGYFTCFVRNFMYVYLKNRFHIIRKKKKIRLFKNKTPQNFIVPKFAKGAFSMECYKQNIIEHT